ncbi:hypothetical protein APHAL10511_003229 [Amanita phalloides]|nr:hypothetical protein APHAL10511_003229 [Amanita phalloides]
MDLNPQEPKATLFAAGSSPGMNENSMMPDDAGRVPASLSSSPPPVHDQGVIDSERGPFPQATAQAVKASAPAGESTPEQVQRPYSPVPVASHALQDHSASARTGSPQVHHAPDADDEPFVLANPFRLPRARTAPTNTATENPITTGNESQGRSAGAKLITNLSIIIKTVLMSDAVALERWLMLMYINFFLLHLPALYFTRVARVFEDAQLSREEVEQVTKRYRGVMTLSPGLRVFKESWEGLVDSLLREWKTLNLVSALLLTAILTLFQLPGVGTDPVLRNTSFLSLIYALLCLLYGCVYVIRFGSLRSISKGLGWVCEAEQSNSDIWWSIWVFLALPSLYFTFSMLWFVVTVLGFIWQSGAVGNVDDHSPLSFKTALAPRIIITVQLLPGLSYFVMIVRMMWTHEMSAVGIAERGEV